MLGVGGYECVGYRRKRRGGGQAEGESSKDNKADGSVPLLDHEDEEEVEMKEQLTGLPWGRIERRGHCPLACPFGRPHLPSRGPRSERARPSTQTQHQIQPPSIDKTTRVGKSACRSIQADDE